MIDPIEQFIATGNGELDDAQRCQAARRMSLRGWTERTIAMSLAISEKAVRSYLYSGGKART